MYVMLRRYRSVYVAAVVAVAACSGSTSHPAGPGPIVPAAPAAATPTEVTSAVDVPLTIAGAKVALSLGDGYNATMTVQSQRNVGGQKLTLQVSKPLASDRRTLSSGSKRCPQIPPIKFTAPFDLTLHIGAFTIALPCSVAGQSFVGTYVQLPTPNSDVTITPTTLFTIVGVNNTLSSPGFTLTLKAGDAYAITISPLAAGFPNSQSFPVAAGMSILPTDPKGPDVAFGYEAGSGGRSYSAGCRLPTGPNDPALALYPPAGTVVEICHFDPGANPITFGASVTYGLDNLPLDRAGIAEDGPPGPVFISNLQSNVATTANIVTPPFTISESAASGYQNALIVQVRDLQVCQPPFDGPGMKDCNDHNAAPAELASNAQYAPGIDSISKGRQFPILVASDPTYKPGVSSPGGIAATWDGYLYITTKSGDPCSPSLGPDQPESYPDYPNAGAPYWDGKTVYGQKEMIAYNDPVGTSANLPSGITLNGPTIRVPGPLVEADIDVAAGAAGTCTVTVTEDPVNFFATDYGAAPGTPRTSTKVFTIH